MSNVVLCLSHNIVCVNLEPKAAISRGEQNRYGWRRRTLLTARLIKFYGGLRLMKSTAAYGGLQRRLGALVRISRPPLFNSNYVYHRSPKVLSLAAFICNLHLTHRYDHSIVLFKFVISSMLMTLMTLSCSFH